MGLLQACALMGRHDYKNCVVFHSLSKRSNLPGLRSGFVAGDAHILAAYLKYRTYHGAALPVQHQLASTLAWQDESHVEANRQLYRQKFDLFIHELGSKLPLQKPDAGFYFWLSTWIMMSVLPSIYMKRRILQYCQDVIYPVIRQPVIRVKIMCELHWWLTLANVSKLLSV